MSVSQSWRVLSEDSEKIRKATLEDRLGGKDARTLLMKRFTMNELAAKGAGNIDAKQKALVAEADQALTDSVNAASLTPRLNELQWLISESLIYGAKDEAA